MRDASSIKVPLDQSAFDNNQSKSTILAVLFGIHDHIIHQRETPAEYKEVWSVMWKALTTVTPKVLMEGEERAWENGIPSGWRWTALLDPLLNIVSFRVATRYAREHYDINVPVSMANMQGDDVILRSTLRRPNFTKQGRVSKFLSRLFV